MKYNNSSVVTLNIITCGMCQQSAFFLLIQKQSSIVPEDSVERGTCIPDTENMSAQSAAAIW